MRTITTRSPSSALGWLDACWHASSPAGVVECACTNGVPIRATGAAERGRSINLAISERGLDALRRIDLADEIMADALPMRGRMVHSVDGTLDFQPYSASGDRAINSISRAALNHALLDAAEAGPGVGPGRTRNEADVRPSARRARPVGCPRRFDDVRDASREGPLRGRRSDRSGRRRIGGARAAARRRRPRRAPRLPRLRLQGAAHPAAARRVRPRPGGVAHLAAPFVDDDRPPQPGPLVHVHPVLAQRRDGMFRRLE